MDPIDLDSMCKKFGFPVGTATLIDEVGIDVGVHIAIHLGKVLGQRFRSGDVNMFNDMIQAGFLGIQFFIMYILFFIILFRYIMKYVIFREKIRQGNICV